jgi:hypothetical protein
MYRATYIYDSTRRDAGRKWKQTSDEAFIRSHASPYKTVAEFFENNSVVNEYAKSTESPAPRRMTVKLVVLAVVLMTKSVA